MKKEILILPITLLITMVSFSQKKDSVQNNFNLKTAVTFTTKGISLLPTFTLGKPAAIFDLSMGRKKLFFEPQLRFSLEGKPWSFIFWWRYKLLNAEKFKLSLGAHPALTFKTIDVPVNGISTNIIQTQRYLATELAPNYFISKNVSIGLYYLYSHGIDDGSVNNTHFVTINSNFSHIKLYKDFYARFAPQLYYLYQDGHDGTYFTYALTLAKKGCPFTIQSIGNKILKTNITASENFIWNVSLIYSFNKSYVQHK